MSEERTSKLMLWILAELENGPNGCTTPELTSRRCKKIFGRKWDNAEWWERRSAVEIRTTVIARSLKRLLKREKVFKAGIGNTTYWFLPKYTGAFVKQHLQTLRWEVEDARKKHYRLIEQENSLDELMNCEASSQSINKSALKEQSKTSTAGGQR